MDNRDGDTLPQSTLHVAVVLAGVPLCVPGLIVGAGLTTQLSLIEAIAAAALGCLVLTIYAGWTGSLGAQTGLSTAELLRSSFGTSGSRIVSGVIGLCLAGWYAVQTGFFGRTVHALFPGGGTVTSVEGAALWGGLLMLSSAFFGFRGLAKLSLVAVPLLLLLTIVALFQVAGASDMWAPKPATPGAFGAAVTMVIGSFAIGATVNPDITRYCRSSTGAWLATVVGFFVMSMYIFICGAVTSIATGSSDLIGAMVGLGFGAFAFVTLVLSQWTTNDNNLFAATTSMRAVLPDVDQRVLVIVFGASATLAGVVGLADSFVDFLLWLGVVIPPIGGVMIAHDVFDRIAGYRSIAVVGLPVAAFGGVVLGAVVGKVLPCGVPAVSAIVAGGVGYVLLRLLFRAHYGRAITG